jgi:glucose-6-phosphate isomerase
MTDALRCDDTVAWGELRQHFERSGRALDLRRAFEADAGRVEALSQDAPYIFADLSKNLTDARTEQLLLELARERGLEAQRDAMFAGRRINHTEDRAVMHWLLRRPPESTPTVATARRTDPVTNSAATACALASVHQTLDAMLAFAEQVRGDPDLTDIVHIGIGGSDLGPQMVVQALAEFVTPGKRFHFVSNVDGHELASVLQGLVPQHTLFLIASKTFTTAETMLNAQSAKRWFVRLGGRDIARHFAALTTNVQAAQQFGIETCFGFWDWVGGRYSLWSAIGLPIALAIGAPFFRAFLAGAHAMDEHFRTAPLAHNLPVRLGMLDLWYRNFHGFGSRCIAPYHAALRRLPAFLQQLEMESNGKQVDASGQPVRFGTAPVLWGEPGTNGQHAYFQMLHQGTDVVPLEFIVVREAGHDLPGHQPQLLANAVAQAQALMVGQTGPAASVLGNADAAHARDSRARSTHRHFPGNRPSSFFIVERLTPEVLGAFVALYEHRVFTSGALWGINSFDQWGVELGKVLAQDLEPRLTSGDTAGLDASTAGLLARLRRYP